MWTLCFCLIIACQQQKWPDEALHGQWDSSQLDFNFKSDGRYELDYGTKLVEGKFWIESDYLHTIEDQQSEMKVKILSLNQDSLVIDMNRGGHMERVILLKQ